MWETAYLLLNYLRSLRLSCRNFLEVGAGCGLVGLGVHRAKEISIADQVILTETKPVVRNLMQNFKRNHSRASNAKDDDVSLRVCQLDWTCFFVCAPTRHSAQRRRASQLAGSAARRRVPQGWSTAAHVRGSESPEWARRGAAVRKAAESECRTGTRMHSRG